MRLPRTLFGRLLLVFLLFGVVMTAALLYVMQVSHSQFHQEFDQTVNRDLARRYVAANFLLTDRNLTASTLHQGIKKLAAANPEIDVYLLDETGGIVAASVPEIDRHRTRINLQPIKEFIAGRAAPTAQWRYPEGHWPCGRVSNRLIEVGCMENRNWTRLPC